MTMATPKTVVTTGAPTAAAVSSIGLLAVAAGLSGPALLAWWAVSFHYTGAMLWMVPAGLVLADAPLLA